MTTKVYRDGDIVLARYMPAASLWDEPLQFFSEDGEYIQVGSWNYDSGKRLLAHIHNPVTRTVEWTQEVLVIVSGSLRVTIYDTKENLVDQFVARQGDVLAMLAGGHGYEILEDGTRVVEVKNGPYVGAAADRRRIEAEIPSS